MSERHEPVKAVPSSINRFLVDNGIWIRENPGISPDMTLDFGALLQEVRDEGACLAGLSGGRAPEEVAEELESVILWPKSRFSVDGNAFYLVESAATGDCGLLSTTGEGLPFDAAEGVGEEQTLIPLYWGNLINWKNYVLADSPDSTIFPRAAGPLEHTSFGIGARFTTLHWPGVAWAMKHLGMSLTANQNSVPRELVYDVEAMGEGKLTEMPFPFIGGSVPEGHQGQSVQGMSHAAVVTYLKYGFHRNAIPWGFNADHQPIGGRFDEIEDKLVEGSLFASYITYDLSPELANAELISDPKALETEFDRIVDKELYEKVLEKLADSNIAIIEEEVRRLVTYITPAMIKMKRRDELYTAIRTELFDSEAGRRFYKELSIDELPGRTTPETLAVCLAMAEAMGVDFQFVAPNIGFQKNFPYRDNEELRKKVGVLYAMAEKFGVSIGFHSGSGKSAENYRICGSVTSGRFEVKTSGRYTYEMGMALSKSTDEGDRHLWEEWYDFTRRLALQGAFADNEVQRRFAREFITRSLEHEGHATEGVFDSPERLGKVLASLPPSPDHMFWFEYNFLFVLAAGGSAEKLGDHGPEGYEQRRRFYAISEEGRLLFARRVARYIIFLAETTGVVSKRDAEKARNTLDAYFEYRDLLGDIAG